MNFLVSGMLREPQRITNASTHAISISSRTRASSFFARPITRFKNIAMPWSMGKDSNVLIWLARKSFFGKVPFPVLHIDTTYEFPEMLEFREWATKHYKLNLIVKINDGSARARDRLRDARSGDGDARAEDGGAAAGAGRTQVGRADHRDSPRRGPDPGEGEIFLAAQRAVRVGLQRSAAGVLGTIRHAQRKGEHVRVQPLLDWTEVDIWRYIQREKIPIPKMYFSRDGKRFRSLGCSPITKPIVSNASTIDEIIAELEDDEDERARRPRPGSL